MALNYNTNKSKRCHCTLKSSFNTLPNNKILDHSILNAFADNKLKMIQMAKFVLDKIENIVGKKENAGNQYSITCIQRPVKESNESGLLQPVVCKCRFYWVDLRRVVVSE